MVPLHSGIVPASAMEAGLDQDVTYARLPAKMVEQYQRAVCRVCAPLAFLERTAKEASASRLWLHVLGAQPLSPFHTILSELL